MSAQFGRWSFDGGNPPTHLLERVNTALAPYGPDNGNSYHNDGVGILYRAFHTTKESRTEAQPYVSRSGAVVTWDGRLDNRAEFIALMDETLETGSPDVSIVASAYERWGTRCFARLLGDWALSIWDPNKQSLTLAKDPLGTRHLYYSIDKDQVMWSTILDPLILFARKTLTLCEEYVAGWLSFFPATHLTPYVEIDSVPPACFVRLQPRKRTISKYWDFDPEKLIRYRTDAEYEEHFRAVLTEAVQRRLRSDSPVLAELSGGMDSSSIVCTADMIIARRGADTPRLDTVSYYNDSEPHWNERPYFTRVEEKRGRTGCHIEVRSTEPEPRAPEWESFAATPFARKPTSQGPRQFASCLAAQANRVVLSGIGGDEVMGGVPTPLPELMDLVARARFKALARQLTVWALDKRKPWIHLFLEAVRGFLPVSLVGVPQYLRPAHWLDQGFVERQRAALRGYPARVRLLGPLPSFQECVFTCDALRRQLASSVIPSEPVYEKRFPYLDRTLLEFIFAVPRTQLVRPGERRSLMRRALTGIVPDELLNRKRKAFVSRSPTTAICAEWTHLIDRKDDMVSHTLGILDADAFSREVERARRGEQVHLVAMSRMLGVESWLRAVRDQEILRSSSPGSARGCAMPGAQNEIGERSLKSSAS
jgi:asparagine synthase (glutamine-hydrolysing)